MANTQFIGRQTATLANGVGTPITIPEALRLSDGAVTLVFESIGANAQLCSNADGSGLLLNLPTVGAGSLPFSLGGLRAAAGSLYLTASSGSPAVAFAIVQDV